MKTLHFLLVSAVLLGRLASGAELPSFSTVFGDKNPELVEQMRTAWMITVSQAAAALDLKFGADKVAAVDRKKMLMAGYTNWHMVIASVDKHEFGTRCTLLAHYVDLRNHCPYPFGWSVEEERLVEVRQLSRTKAKTSAERALAIAKRAWQAFDTAGLSTNLGGPPVVERWVVQYDPVTNGESIYTEKKNERLELPYWRVTWTGPDHFKVTITISAVTGRLVQYDLEGAVLPGCGGDSYRELLAKTEHLKPSPPGRFPKRPLPAPKP